MRTPILLALSLPIAVLLVTPRASAQPVDAATKSAARPVAEEALKLYDKGDYAAAYEKANRANDLVHAPTMALLTGRCLEKLGRFVEASEKYLEATHDTLEPNASDAQKSAQIEADKARTALLPRIPAVELALDPPGAGAAVILDGKPVPAAMVGIKRPIDPGKHTVAISRGGENVTQDFALKEAESVRIVLKAPGRVGPAPVAPQPLAPGQPPLLMYPPGTTLYPPGTTPVLVTERRSTGMFVTGIIFIPIGAITALVGGVLLAAGDSTGSGDATSSGGGALAVGGLMLAGGIALTVIGGKKVPVHRAALLDPTHSPPAPKASVEPLLSPTFAGARVHF